MAMPTLIYCAGGNPRFAEIAVSAGFRYGAQLPDTIYQPLYFADQNWKCPDREAYLQAIAKHRPYMASVLDWEHHGQLGEVLAWAEDVAPYVQVIMIIPKVSGGTYLIPRVIGGKPVRLGYSVPSRYGGTNLMLWEFEGWPVHLLGGSPNKQIALSRYLKVMSADGNMAMKMAIRYCAFFVDRKRYSSGHWVSLKEADGQKWENDAPYEAFQRSCLNIMAAWKQN